MNAVEKALPIILIALCLGAFGLMKLPMDTVLWIARGVGWVLAVVLVMTLVIRGLIKRNS
jgi:hypothetical protein